MHKKSRNFIVFLLFFLIAWFGRVLIYKSFDSKVENDYFAILFSGFLKLLIWVIPAFVFVKIIDKKDPFKYLKFSTSIEKGLIFGVALLIAGIAYQLILLHFKLDVFKFDLPSFFGTILLTPILEETLYRGFIYNKFRELTSEWKANVAQSILFIYIHIPGWIILQHIGFREFVINSISIFILSLILGFLVKKTNSIYPSIALHSVNNFISAL